QHSPWPAALVRTLCSAAFLNYPNFDLAFGSERLWGRSGDGFAARPRGHTCECGFAHSPSKADVGLGRQRQITAAVGCFCEGWLSKCTAPIFVVAPYAQFFSFSGNARRSVGIQSSPCYAPRHAIRRRKQTFQDCSQKAKKSALNIVLP